MITTHFSNAGERKQPAPSGTANLVWIAVLVVAGVGGSVVISCITPFAALGVALAGTVRRSAALSAMIAIWLTNQVIGFAFLGFPWTSFTISWGIAIGAAALLSAFVATVVLNRLPSMLALWRIGIALLLAYLAYQFSLFLAALFIGSFDAFTFATLAEIGLSNVLWLAGIVVLNELLAIACRPWLGLTPRLLTAT